MGKRDPRIDAYIARAAPFARPILKHLRALVHETCPDCEETLKWSMPSFTYAGGILCTMASFKEHATFGFWKGALIVDPKTNRNTEAMGQFGRITSVADLPGKAKLAGYIRQAMKLNEEGVTVKRRLAQPRKPLTVPADLKSALAKSAKAKQTFDEMPPSHRREYVEWIVEAKRDETRRRRVAAAVEGIAAGRSRNWKYER